MGKRWTLDEIPATDPGLLRPVEVDHDLHDGPEAVPAAGLPVTGEVAAPSHARASGVPGDRRTAVPPGDARAGRARRYPPGRWNPRLGTPGPSGSALRRYLPFVAGIVVIAVVHRGREPGRRRRATRRPPPPTTGGGPPAKGPVTLERAQPQLGRLGPEVRRRTRDRRGAPHLRPALRQAVHRRQRRRDRAGRDRRPRSPSRCTRPSPTSSSRRRWPAAAPTRRSPPRPRPSSSTSTSSSPTTRPTAARCSLVVVKASGAPDDDAAARADAIKVATEVKAFASFGGPGETEAYAQELAARGVLCLGDCMLASSQSFVDQRAPQHLADAPRGRPVGHPLGQLRRPASSTTGPPQYAGDAAFTKQKRVFGLVRFDESFAGFQQAGKAFVRLLKQQGVKLAADAPVRARHRQEPGERPEHDREAQGRARDHRALRRRPAHARLPHQGGHRAEVLPRVGRARRGVQRHLAVRPHATTRRSGSTRSA